MSGRGRAVHPEGRPQRSPLEALTPTQLRRLAKRADKARSRDVAEFEFLAASASITPRQLRLVADAWAEGGHSGLAAIGPAREVDDVGVMDRAEAVIETWRRRHFPLDAFEVSTWRNVLTVDWMVPAARRSQGLVRRPLMQLRRTEDGRWHLYRRAIQGEWWPVLVRGRRRRQPLSACLDAVRVDPLHHFWGEGGPPVDLADGDALPDSPLG
ncbi:hypothetical protein [Euzebya tangerina]|uniref:DUF3024 domain-containing protein n=1 Tax=Euzebya tangerina TaxID=591198 RepID=UPI0013C356EA|nr:hypothetical protein [Euzebya tangerina]